MKLILVYREENEMENIKIKKWLYKTAKKQGLKIIIDDFGKSYIINSKKEIIATFPNGINISKLPFLLKKEESIISKHNATIMQIYHELY